MIVKFCKTSEQFDTINRNPVMEQFRVNAKQGKRKIKLNVSLGDSTWRGSTSTSAIVIKEKRDEKKDSLSVK